MTRSQRESGEQAVYVISVAAELAGVHPQTLRIYERKGLVRPRRTAGNTRRYTPADIERLRRIQRLTQQQGVNLAGVSLVLELEDEVARLREELARTTARMQALEAALNERMREAARMTAAILPASAHRTLQQFWREEDARRLKQRWKEGRSRGGPSPAATT